MKHKQDLNAMPIPAKSHTTHLPLIIEMDEDGIYIISCPVLKACHSYGKTIQEAIDNIKEVIAICLEEQDLHSINSFVGFRELEVTI
jgi:predicted RNase H-like HicB family nuclease